MYSSEDLKNIDEIKQFLESNDIDYSTKYDNFCLHYDNPNGKRSYQIEYVPSRHFPIGYPKYGIHGVDVDHFYKLSHQAENEHNSFKCWVKDFEWNNERKREVLKSYFLHAAGKTKYTFYARECEVRVVGTKQGRQFESENCFYGKRGASLSLGLFTKKEKHGVPKDTLIMIYTFGLNFFGKDQSIEILRVGTKRFCNVAGGASKLLKHFITYYPTLKVGKNLINVKKLKFYSDYDHNIGNSMDTLGFDFVSYSKGGFMNLWLETGEIKNREPHRHKWVMEQMAQGKVLAIPNAGVKTFVLDLEKHKDKYNIVPVSQSHGNVVTKSNTTTSPVVNNLLSF